MQKLLFKLLIGFFVLLSLPLSFLFNPVHAQASTKKTPVTSFQTLPGSPKGENGWYNSVTLIELDTNKTGTTFFQWNTTSGEWKRYKNRIRAWQGENTLYFYSVNQGIAEPVKSRVIKVDYQKPVIDSLTVSSKNAQVNLAWSASKDAVSFNIYRKQSGNYSLIAQTIKNDFSDKTVEPKELYIYAIKAVDAAGWSSEKEAVHIIAAEALPVAKIKPQIAGGSSVLPATKPVVAKDAEPKAVNKDNEPTPLAAPVEAPVKNWSRLLIAISILVIATGAAIGGYYGYEWWASRGEEEKPTKKNSRW